MNDFSLFIGIPDIHLECGSKAFNASFTLKELQNRNLPFSIKLSGNHTCESINASSVGNIDSNGNIWISAEYTECGVRAYYEGKKIAFEQTIIVQYGSEDKSSPIYKSFNDSYKIKCLVDRNMTQRWLMNVNEREDVATQKGKSGFCIISAFQNFKTFCKRVS